MTPFLFGMIFMAIAIACAAWYMGDARGRSPWLGALASLLFGWAVLVYYGIAGDKDSGKEWQAVAAAFGVFVASQILLRIMF
jgi:hypothetical protein